MTYKYWLLFGSLSLGATQTVGCSSEFKSCQTTHTCAPGGAGGVSGAAGGGAVSGGSAHAGLGGGSDADAGEGGNGGGDTQGGEGGTTDNGDNAGGAGIGGDSSVEADLEITPPTLDTGKTYVPFTGKISASGAKHYTWSIASGALPAGLTLQGTQSASVTIVGTPTQAGQFPITLSVTDGATTKTVDVTLGVTHPALFLSDRNIAGVNELFLAEIGAATAAAPVQLSATLPAGGGVTNYAWSPDGSKVMYVATQSPGGAAELWVAALALPGAAQRVNTVGTTVGRIAWLGAGNIALYSTSVGDTYLADLSGPTPLPSKLAIAGKGSAAFLSPTPNGRSAVIVTPIPSASANNADLVTWQSDAPAIVPLLQSFPGGNAQFSYDGRFVMITAGSGALWADLSLPAPTMQFGGQNHGAAYAWSPNVEMFLAETGTDKYELSRYDLTGGGFGATVLVPSEIACQIYVKPWSPDGKNGLFTCGNDLRAISDIATATVSSDFSLFPGNPSSPIYDVNWSPNSQWVVARVGADLNLIRWSAPGVLHKPHANTLGSGVTKWAVAQNSQSVAFVGTIAPQNNAGLYLTKLPASGAPPTATLVSAPASAVVQDDINWLPGSRVITYRANVTSGAQLFAVPVAADGTAGSPIPISGASGSGVTSYQLAPAR